MKPASSILVLLTCLLTLAACQRTPRVYQAQLFVFGTVVDVSIQGVDEAAADRAFRELQQDFQAMHRDWHAWEPGLLTGINEDFAAGRPVVADAGIVEMVRRSRQIEAASGGRFNPAIGALVRLWGFHTSEYPIEGPPPLAEAIRALVDQRPSTLDSHIDGLTLNSNNPAVQLDFGGIAKGYAADEALQVLREMGINHAMVDASGDLAFGDAPPGKAGWKVQIAALDKSALPQDVLVLKNCGAATSGDKYQFLEVDGKRYSHIVDPRTGYGVLGKGSFTVIAPNATQADALASAVSVLGLDGINLLKKTDHVEGRIQLQIDDKIQTKQTAGFEQFLK